ncbi:HEAT repeat domain-containing protein [Dactylosporangium sp. NPDC049525]|uniref:HEAT repeat domain-containing protein n=1 Tax=Dactylosporangium sp. NPDC049525 TaxID=3154730 RepID=UPI00343C9BC6
MERADLERRLAEHVDAGDTVARDAVAHALATTYGAAALPALLRASVHDRNDDGESLQLDVLELFEAWPGEARAEVLACVSSADPGLRRVGVWGLSVIDLDRRGEHVALVVEAASDPDPRVRGEALGGLGSIFGAGDPRALAALTAGTRDPDPEVRCAAVQGLHSWPGEAVTAVLVARAADADRRVRFWTAWALSGRPGAAATLERLTADDDPDVRAAAGDVLAIGRRASGALEHPWS